MPLSRRRAARPVLLVLAPLLAAATLLGPTAAHAATHTGADAASDVVVSTGGKPGKVDADHRNGDVLSAKVVHGPKAVTLELGFAKLVRTGTWQRHFFRLVTDEGVRRELVVDAAPGRWAGRATLTGLDQHLEACDVRPTITYAADSTARVRVVLPRVCLSGPSWVRVSAGTVTASGSSVHADDARTRGKLYDAPVFGPKVARG